MTMSCNSCAKPFNLLRKEKGCPGCGFSFCQKCLNNTIFLEKLNKEAKVCVKCKRSPPSNAPKKIEPPDAYYKRIGLDPSIAKGSGNIPCTSQDPTDEEIKNRLEKLKENKVSTVVSTNDVIADRLQKLKGDVPKCTDAELQERLDKLRGVSTSAFKSQPLLITSDTRSEQEQADDLLKQYMEQTSIDKQYDDKFNEIIKDAELRLNNLKGTDGPATQNSVKAGPEEDSEDEETAVAKIVEKVKVEATLDKDEPDPSTIDELPFCEICNEDATMRCLGCRYLFCKRCFKEHMDDEECNKFEPYKAPKPV